MAEQKQQLAQLLEEVKQFRNNYILIQDYKKEIKTKIIQIFRNCFQDQINKFEQSLQTKANLQQMQNESFKEYLIIIQQNKQIFMIFELQVTLRKYKCLPSENEIDQEYLIQKIKKIYLQGIEEGGDDEDYLESKQKLGLFDGLKQKYKDFNNNDEWKIKQGLIFTIVFISSNCFTDTIISFCQKALIQLWVLEKDQRVRNLLKNQHLISLQMQIFQKDWQTQHNRIAEEMQKMLKRIDELQEQITQEANLNNRELYLKEMDETTQQLDEYIQNISEMGQQLRLVTDFVNHIRKSLLRVEGKINQIKEQLNNIGNDLKFLRGKSEAAEKNVKSIYIPLKTQDRGKNEISNLMNLYQFNDNDGEVNEFLYEGKTQDPAKVLQPKKIEDNKKIGNYVLIPVYISLPSLKNPVFQAVEESLKQDDYGFDDLQLKECKEMLQKKEFRLILIMDSYDEMKLENIQKNLYINNKLKQYWSDPLVIFSTRSDIFTSSHQDKQKFKETQLLQFEQSQIQEYLKKFTFQSIKILIFLIYINALDVKRFEQSWEKIQSSFLKFEEARWKSETPLNENKSTDDEFIDLKSNEAIRSLSINLQKQWSFKKYEDMMIVSKSKQFSGNSINDGNYTTEIINIKQTFLKNFQKMLNEFFISKYKIQMYKSQQKRYLLGLKNELNKESEAENQADNDEFLEVTLNDLSNLGIIDYHEIALGVWNYQEENSIPQQLQISQDCEGVHQQLENIFETNLLLPNQILKKIKIQQEKILQIGNDALKEHNLTISDFYDFY
ncbi:unnamed protein product [Paramecium pentaurelia]|uniref:Uncharacterized protein n=1 Tax=Paramecium pentaurelia TaxID=43138 RepID=A0A8S1Y5Z9_9CILI|nr:unnamed protein product [Paramecium pentaurelia]